MKAQATQLRDRIHQMDALASELTGLSLEQIGEARFEIAYEVLQKQIGTDAFGLEMLPQQPVFWGWWRKEWLRVDELLFDGSATREPLVRFDASLLMTFYRDEHGKERRITDEDDMASLYLYYHSANSAVYKQCPWLWESFHREVTGAGRQKTEDRR